MSTSCSSHSRTLPTSIEIGDLLVYRGLNAEILDIGLVTSFKFDEVLVLWQDGGYGIYSKGFALEHKHEYQSG